MEDAYEKKSLLRREKHVSALKKGLCQPLPAHFQRAFCAQTWTVYWISHSLSLLDEKDYLDRVSKNVITFMKECEHPDGGYSGSPGQIAHIATTYAAISALIVYSSDEALESINRNTLVKFFHRLKQPDGSFAVHDDGEIDSRSVYCVVAVLTSLNIHDPVLLENVVEWILSCQTYEGGFGSLPGAEAHGGYTFCCVASLYLLSALKRANLPALIRWLSEKQLSDDLGFCGRSNKLVDSCYSFWQGASFPMIHPFLERIDGDRPDQSRETFLPSWLFDEEALQKYVLESCQSKDGLFKDKPGTNADFYHTCYALSGLSLSQHQPNGDIYNLDSNSCNTLELTHPIYNVTVSALEHCRAFFRNKRMDISKAAD